MNAVLENMARAMSDSIGPSLAVMLLSLIPVAEARFAIPFGMKMGLTPLQSFGWAFLGSSIIAPILLLTFIPIVTALSKTKIFSKLGKFMYDKFEKKSRSVSAPPSQGESKKLLTKSDIKRMAGVGAFVAVPLPLTGVWTGSAVAAILKIGFFKSFIAISCGNIIACGIITLISFLFADYIDIIMWIFLAIIAIVVIFVIIKFILYKPDRPTDKVDSDRTSEINSDTDNNRID